jgi:signal transduction histidine kinase
MDYEAPDTKLTVCASAEGVAQIFSNLIGNAVKYTPADGELTVHLTQQTGNAVITISDTGIGIPAKDLPHLWDEFFRASNARRSQIIGTGLGLSIVKRLVDSYGGMISVQSVEGKGTTFTVSLPIAPID